MSKRVLLDGVSVVNVAAGLPAWPGAYLDVPDTMAVSPGSIWNGSTSSPTFTPPPAATLADGMRTQVAQGVTVGGTVTFTWPMPFRDVPLPFGPLIMDPAGGRYTHTLLALSASGASLRVAQQRPLPSTLTLLTQLMGFDTYTAAPDGLTCYLAAKLPQ